MITRFASLSSRMAVVSALLFAIAACGGGGGGGSDKGGFIPPSTGDQGDYKLKPTITDAAGNETATVTSATPVFLTVVVKNRSNGNRKSGVLVSAVTDSGGTVAQILPASGTAVSDSNGEASFQIAVGEGRGGDRVLISANTENGTSLAEIGIQVGQTGLRIGHFVDGQFIEGEIGLSDSELSVGGSAALSLAVVDENDELAITPERIRLKSGCTLSGAATMPDSVDTTNGKASASYTDKGCGGEDTITASLESNGATALGTVYLADPQADVVEYISATSRVIAIKGTASNGRSETATIVFGVYSGTQGVTDPNDPTASTPGTPLSGANVQFSLSTDVGGIQLQSTSGTTSSDGTVSTVIKSGNVATTVRVIATVESEDGTTVFTTSDAIAVTTGLPDQNSISLSTSSLTADGAADTDGVYTCLTVRMADKFNNPVIDGTQALFTTEYGAVDDFCITGQQNGKLYLDTCFKENPTLWPEVPINGECSVAWISQNPRGPGLDENAAQIQNIGNYTKCDDGRGLGHNGTSGPCPADLGPVRALRTTILVTAEGEEYFVDANGNGLYDQGESFDNLPEAFVDHNEDRVYTPKVGPKCPSNPNDPDGSRCAAAGDEETFTDFNNDGKYNLNVDANGNGVYNGSLCPEEGDGIWCSRELVNVRDDTVLIMSTARSNFYIQLVNTRTGRIVTTTQEGDQFMAYISDSYNNRPGGDTTVTVEVSGACSLLSPDTFDVPDSNAYGALGVPIVTGGDNSGDSGIVTVTLKDEFGDLGVETFGCQTFFVDPNGPTVSPNG